MSDPKSPPPPSVIPPSAIPVERVRSDHPDADWRADAFAGSRHSRWSDELRAPLESHDPERAAQVCGTVCRELLRDFAPALILLPPTERRRLQALATYTFTLYDFARQTGVEGERLAAINRWEFALESALDGDPPGQPAFVLMAEAEAARPWNREALDRVAQEARRRALEPRPATVASHRRESESLAAALATAYLGDPPSERGTELLAALFRLYGLLALGDGLRRRTPALPREELAEHWWDGSNPERAVERALRKSLARLTEDLQALRGAPRELPRPYRRAALYAHRTARALRRRIERTPRPGDDFPVLGALARIGGLLRARCTPVGR